MCHSSEEDFDFCTPHDPMWPNSIRQTAWRRSKNWSDQKLDRGGQSLALIWAYNLFLSWFAHCHIQMYCNRWRSVCNGLVFSSKDRKIINLLESLVTSIQWKSLICFLRVDRRAFLSLSSIAHFYCPIVN